MNPQPVNDHNFITISIGDLDLMRKTIGMLNCMIECGEYHTEQSRAMVEHAMLSNVELVERACLPVED